MNVLPGERYKQFTKESRGLLRGDYGRLPAPVNEHVRAKANIKPGDVISCRPADLLKPGLEKYREQYKSVAKSEGDTLSLALFPQVAADFLVDLDENMIHELYVEYQDY